MYPINQLNKNMNTDTDNQYNFNITQLRRNDYLREACERKTRNSEFMKGRSVPPKLLKMINKTHDDNIKRALVKLIETF